MFGTIVMFYLLGAFTTSVFLYWNKDKPNMANTMNRMQRLYDETAEEKGAETEPVGRFWFLTATCLLIWWVMPLAIRQANKEANDE